MDGANDPPLVEALRYTYTRPNDPATEGEPVEEGHTWYDTDGDAAYIRTAGGAWRRLDIANHADLSGVTEGQHRSDSNVAALAPVQSVNGYTGTPVLDAADVGALADSYTAPVQSVNGQTGAVNINLTVEVEERALIHNGGFAPGVFG